MQGLLNRFFSLDFGQPIGQHIADGPPRGYYIDMSVKAEKPRWTHPDHGAPPQLWAVEAQFGLGAFERYLASQDERWLATAVAVGDHLVAEQCSPPGPHRGAWLHDQPLGHTFRLVLPWVSGMAQGEAASLLVRLFLVTGNERFAEAALAAMAPLRLSTAGGGVAAPINGGALPEEYPTSPPSRVLNGAIYALWGMRDVATGLDDQEARSDFYAATAVLAANLHRWDTGSWSRYDLFPHRRVNVASFAYHALHIDQLRVLESMCAHAELSRVRQRFEGYAQSRGSRIAAFTQKSRFRLSTSRRSEPAR